MMMVTDATQSPKSGVQIAEELEAVGKEIGVVIRCQHEDIFNMMHRI
jgi:ACT domain-containing protein